MRAPAAHESSCKIDGHRPEQPCWLRGMYTSPDYTHYPPFASMNDASRGDATSDQVPPQCLSRVLEVSVWIGLGYAIINYMKIKGHKGSR